MASPLTLSLLLIHTCQALDTVPLTQSRDPGSPPATNLTRDQESELQTSEETTLPFFSQSASINPTRSEAKSQPLQSAKQQAFFSSSHAIKPTRFQEESNSSTSSGQSMFPKSPAPEDPILPVSPLSSPHPFTQLALKIFQSLPPPKPKTKPREAESKVDVERIVMERIKPRTTLKNTLAAMKLLTKGPTRRKVVKKRKDQVSKSTEKPSAKTAKSKIRFRPKKKYQSELLPHTQVNKNLFFLFERKVTNFSRRSLDWCSGLLMCSPSSLQPHIRRQKRGLAREAVMVRGCQPSLQSR